MGKPKLVKSHVKDKIILTAASLANESGQINLLLNHVFLFIPSEAMKKKILQKSFTKNFVVPQNSSLSGRIHVLVKKQ